MTKQDHHDDLLFQLTMELESKGLRVALLTKKEYFEKLYEMALEKLAEKES